MKKKRQDKTDKREISDSWNKNNRLHWPFSNFLFFFFSFFFFFCCWQNVMFSPIVSHGLIRPSRPSAWNTHRSVEKERRGKKRKFIQIHRDDNVVVDEEGCSWKTMRIQTTLCVIYLKGSIEFPRNHVYFIKSDFPILNWN